MHFPSPDDDWLFPESPSVSTPVALPAFEGVYLVDAEGEEAMPFPSLFDATREPPRDQEAQVRGRGGVLAECDRDHAQWCFTAIGKARLDRETRGLAKTEPAIASARRTA